MFIFRLYNNLQFRITRNSKLNNATRRQLKVAKATTIICIILIFAEILFSILDLYQGKTLGVTFNILGACVFIYTIYLFTNGKSFKAKMILICSCTLLIIVVASTEGKDAGNQFFLIPIICGSVLLFSGKERKYSLLLLLAAILTFIFLEYTSYSLNLYSNPNKDITYINYLAAFSVSVALVYIFVLYLNSINIQWEHRLEKVNSLLNKNNLKLHKVNNELDSYVYKTTHDLRAPLTSLMGLFNLIKNENDINQIKKYMELGEQSVDKMDSYIRNILLISRNSKLSLKIELVQFPEIIDNIFLNLNYLNNSDKILKNISIECKEFYSDQTRIQILLNNLLANAIIYSDTSKKERKISVKIVSNVDECVISIWDNGIGIQETHLKNIFDMYYRASDKAIGSGLGLYIVKETAAKLNGNITVKSQIREWTEFKITLPNLINETV